MNNPLAVLVKHAKFQMSAEKVGYTIREMREIDKRPNAEQKNSPHNIVSCVAWSRNDRRINLPILVTSVGGRSERRLRLCMRVRM